MPIKNTTTKVHEVITQMDRSKFDFYLTGSRFFGGARADSDWDFFAEYSNEVVSFLLRIGFRYKPINDYFDSQTVEVLEFGREIDVQLVSNTAIKNIAQEIMRATKWYTITDTNLRRVVWNELYKLATTVRIIVQD